MSIPKCDICGTRHGPKQAHVFASTGAPLVDGPDLTATDVRVRLSGEAASKPNTRERGSTADARPPISEPDRSVSGIADPAASKNDSPALSQSERNARYRLKNRDKYNAYMRDYRKRKKDG